MPEPAAWIRQIEDAAERGSRGTFGPCGEQGCDACDWRPPVAPTPTGIVGEAISMLSQLTRGGGK
jgi:hypothetical protein